MNIATKNAPFGYILVDAETDELIRYCRGFGWKSRLTAERKAQDYAAWKNQKVVVRAATKADFAVC
jgi:hypothetical protein